MPLEADRLVEGVGVLALEIGGEAGLVAAALPALGDRERHHGAADAFAISITGDGALSYTDANDSSITNADAGATTLYVHATGDDGLTPGSITVNTNGGAAGGSFGIHAINDGTGALSIALTGDGQFSGPFGDGIQATNSGTNLTVTSIPQPLPAGFAIETSETLTGPWILQSSTNTPATLPIRNEEALFVRAHKL